jgi:hypothetical protein
MSRIILLLTMAVAIGCGGSKSTDQDVPTDSMMEVAADNTNETSQVCAQIVTGSPEEEVLAGEWAAFGCSLADCPEEDPNSLDLRVAGDPDNYEVVGQDVRFLVPGTYEVVCLYGGEAGLDLVTVEVLPGLPETVTTTLNVDEVVAGTQVVVGCAAADGLGNPIYGPFELIVTPEDGIWQQATHFTPTVVGEYSVACVVDSIHKGNVVQLDVVAGVPKKIYTEMAAHEVEAGKSVKISCRATDKWENQVGGFPLVVVVPPKLSLQGLSISGTETGFYEVKCVPQADDWVLFQLYPEVLTVFPAPPALLKLELVPDKSVYKLLDKVHLQISIRDAYGNLIPDAPLQSVQLTTVEGLPTDGALETQPGSYKFVEEGSYRFTVVSQQDPGVMAQRVVNVDGSGPLLALDYPERGETVDDKPVVNVSGTVSDAVTGLESFTINGGEVEVSPDNSFSHIVTANHALNHLVAEALDTGGETTRATRAFAFSDQWFKASGDHDETFVPAGLQIFLAETFVDDGNHDHSDPNDLATLLEVILAGLDFGTLIPNPIYNANNYKVFITNVTLESPLVGMDLIEGALTVNLTFANFAADVEAIGSCSVLGVDLCPDVSGTLTVDDIALYAVMKVSVVDGSVVVALKDFEMGVTGIVLDLSGLGSLLDPILNGIIGIFEQQVEAALASQLQGLLPDVMAELFAAFQLDENLEIPGLVEGSEATTINLTTTYQMLDLAPAGITMVFDARASSAQKVVHNPLGSIGRGSCAGPEAEPFVISTDQEVSVALSDDLLNQLLFAVWWGGALNLTLDEAVLGDLSGELDGYGISEATIELDFFLAPMLSDCNGEKVLRLGLGDLYIQAQFKMLGQPLTMGIFATAAGDASISLVQSDSGQMEFGVTVEEISLFDYEIVAITEGFEELVPIVEELLAGETLTESLASIAGQSLGGLVLPKIDLGGIVPGVAPGTSLAIYPVALERLFGFTELAAELN